MTTQDIRNEQEQVLADAAERPSELFELLDYIFEHTGTDSGEAEEKIQDEINRWIRDMGKSIVGKKVQLKKMKEQLLSAPILTPVEAYYAMNSGGSGEGERVQSSHISDPMLKNPFSFPAQPIFKVYGDSGGELYVGEQKITIHSIQDYVLLNCETHNAYNASGFCNETILSDDFPELPEGKTQITWTGGIRTVKVIPRWWTL